MNPFFSMNKGASAPRPVCLALLMACIALLPAALSGDESAAPAASAACSGLAPEGAFKATIALDKGDLDLKQLAACLPSLDEAVVGGIAGMTRREDAMALFAGGSDKVRYRLAMNQNINLKTVLLLAADPRLDVRYGLACNPAIGVEALDKAVADADPSVRRGAAQNAALGQGQMEVLAKDPDPLVRCALAENKALAPAILGRLLADADLSVQSAAMRSGPKFPGGPFKVPTPLPGAKVYAAADCQAVAGPDPGKIAALLDSGEIKTEQLQGCLAYLKFYVAPQVASLTRNEADLALLCSLSPDVKKGAARNAMLPASITALLLRDPDEDVRRGLAMDCKDAAVLAQLAGDPDQYVRAGVARNPAAEAALVAGFLKDPATNVRAALAARIGLDAASLEALSKDKAYLVRQALGRNPGIPDELREQLKKDAVPEVQEAAEGKPSNLLRGARRGERAGALRSLLAQRALGQGLSRTAAVPGTPPLALAAAAAPTPAPALSEARLKKAGLLLQLSQAAATAALTPAAQGSDQALVAVMVRQIDPLNALWTAADPEWAKMAARVSQDLQPELPGAIRAAQAGSPAFDDGLTRVLAAKLEEADLDALTAFFQSEKGKRYLAFQAEGAAIFAKGMAAAQSGAAPAFKPQGKPGDADPQGLKPYMDLLALTALEQSLQAKMDQDRLAGRDMSGYGAMGFMFGGVIGHQQAALDQLRSDYAADLKDIEDFNNSGLGRRFYAASAAAASMASQSPDLAVWKALADRHMAAWKTAYAADRQAQQQVTSDANAAGPGYTISTVVGTGVRGHAGENGPGQAAQINRPEALAMDADGDLFIAVPSDACVYKMAKNGILTTVAGSYGPGRAGQGGFAGDGGAATAALMRGPAALAVGKEGELYIADQLNNRIRRVDRNGIISTVAGNGGNVESGDGGAALQAGIPQPYGIAVDNEGDLFVVSFNGARVRKIDKGGLISTVAGGATQGFAGDGGPALQASLRNLRGVAVGPGGELYIADNGNNRIRKVDGAGIISTFAGSGVPGMRQPEDIGDGGPATSAQLEFAFAPVFDAEGNAFFSDMVHQRIRRVDHASGVITSVAGNGRRIYGGDGGPALAASMDSPRSIALGGDGSIYIADCNDFRVRVLTKR